MNENYEGFGALFGTAICGGNYESANGLFAPWLKDAVSADKLREQIEGALAEMNEDWEIDELIYPASFRVGGNPLDFESLVSDESFTASNAISDQITEQNFAKWLVVKFLPDDDDERIDFDCWFAVWMIIVNTADGLAIGYYRIDAGG